MMQHTHIYHQIAIIIAIYCKAAYSLIIIFPPSVLADKMEWSVTGVQLPMVVRLARF